MISDLFCWYSKYLVTHDGCTFGEKEKHPWVNWHDVEKDDILLVDTEHSNDDDPFNVESNVTDAVKALESGGVGGNIKYCSQSGAAVTECFSQKHVWLSPEHVADYSS